MSAAGVRVQPGAYLDSLLLMSATVAMEQSAGVDWAGAVMATPRGLEELAGGGFTGDQLSTASANDLVLAVRADDEEALEAALEAGWRAAFAEREQATGHGADQAPASIAEAVRTNPDLSVAVVSVPGEYAALEAHHALTAGLHVLLFSDGVPLAQEIELKERASELGRLVMGPGAGTAVLSGTGLGFANVFSPRRAAGVGTVGVVAAAGTGAQEVSALLDRWGVGVSQVIGVGGRDLSEEVDGRMARLAVRTLDEDPATDAVLVVSKPPSPKAAARVLAQCRSTPAVAVFLGLSDLECPRDVQLVRTLEQGALAAGRLVGMAEPRLSAGVREAVADRAARLDPGRRTIRGLFSGGTLCYEAQLILEGLVGPVYSNEPLRKQHGLPAPEDAHVLLDLGAEEYTRGVPHPMIEPSGRLELLREVADDPHVAVVLLDVVLGHCSHADPAGELAPVCAELMSDGGPQVVAYVLGTESDPQVYSRQRAILEEAGCFVPETNARAAYAAGALALRQPELADAGT
ncbi:MAG: FdrA protein [Actinomycetota bacterium]|nr:FdrA protein [Actinomycetota bacterium]